MTEQKKYITSKSKRFEKGCDTSVIALWLLDSLEKEYASGSIFNIKLKSKQKYKITITNLKEKNYESPSLNIKKEVV